MIVQELNLPQRPPLDPGDLADAQADAACESRRLIDSFVFADTLPEVYASFGETPYEGDDRDGALAHAEDFGNKHLDFRRGAERAGIDLELPPTQAKALMNMGDETGMTRASNAFEALPADLLVVHGSYKASTINRAALAQQHAAAQALMHPDHPLLVVGLASNRALSDGDKISKPDHDYAPWARTEIELMDAAIEQEFGVDPGEEQVILDGCGQLRYKEPGRVRHYQLPGGIQGLTLSAPGLEGRAHANTADTHRFTAQILGEQMLLGAKVIGVTTQVFAPFKRADLLRTWGLPYGARIEIAGNREAARTRPHNVGQEINSLFDQGILLLKAIKQEQTKRRGA